MAQNDSFPKTSGFPHVSAFQGGSPIGQIAYAPDYKSVKEAQQKLKLDVDVVGVRPADDQPVPEKDMVNVPKTQVDDWIYRLKNIADEVGSFSKLYAAESDLLDLRDELDNLLH